MTLQLESQLSRRRQLELRDRLGYVSDVDGLAAKNGSGISLFTWQPYYNYEENYEDIYQDNYEDKYNYNCNYNGKYYSWC